LPVLGSSFLQYKRYFPELSLRIIEVVPVASFTSAWARVPGLTPSCAGPRGTPVASNGTDCGSPTNSASGMTVHCACRPARKTHLGGVYSARTHSVWFDRFAVKTHRRMLNSPKTWARPSSSLLPLDATVSASSDRREGFSPAQTDSLLTCKKDHDSHWRGRPVEHTLPGTDSRSACNRRRDLIYRVLVQQNGSRSPDLFMRAETLLTLWFHL
jgi:hypothetical protein